MLEINLGNGNIGILQTIDFNNDEISIEFSKLEDSGKLGEHISLEAGESICKLNFVSIAGLENFIEILGSLKKEVYRNNYFYEKMLP